MWWLELILDQMLTQKPDYKDLEQIPSLIQLLTSNTLVMKTTKDVIPVNWHKKNRIPEQQKHFRKVSENTVWIFSEKLLVFVLDSSSFFFTISSILCYIKLFSPVPLKGSLCLLLQHKMHDEAEYCAHANVPTFFPFCTSQYGDSLIQTMTTHMRTGCEHIVLQCTRYPIR